MTKYQAKLAKMSPEQLAKFRSQRARERKRWKSQPKNRRVRKLYKRLAELRQSKMSGAQEHPLIGCSTSFFRGYIEGQWLPGMTWENYGIVWEFDHIIPVSAFNVMTEEGAQACFHYKNLRPLWCHENRTVKVDKHASSPAKQTVIYFDLL